MCEGRPTLATQKCGFRRTLGAARLALVPTQFHALAFEGPDPYARAGGIASRIGDLAREVALAGHESHLWFVGDPRLASRELRDGVELHRWCQWISAHHPAGVYDGEEGKRRDYSRSLPPALVDPRCVRSLEQGGRAVFLAEEWHTAEAVLHLDARLREARVRDRACLFWNANNLFGFDRIDWPSLARAATITTVSRYMKHRMAALGIDAVAIPNGVADEAFEAPDPPAVAQFRARLAGRLVLAKMARFDPDKRWLLAVEIAAESKRRGLRPLLVARGGLEAHGSEVLAHADRLGLRVADRKLARPGTEGLIDALADLDDVDLVHVRSNVDPRARRLLFAGADAVLAQSAHEPFGLVGLETMAVGGLAVTGCTGEEYADPGHSAIVLQSSDPAEFLAAFLELRRRPARMAALRRRGRSTARRFRWREILRLHLFPRVALVGGASFAAGLSTRPRSPGPSIEASPRRSRSAAEPHPMRLVAST